jgi:predicted MPP superfamily phosphohydrolase
VIFCAGKISAEISLITLIVLDTGKRIGKGLKMKIRIASDLHLEAFRGRDMESLIVDVLPSDPQDVESVLVLAGDISADPNQLLDFLRLIEVRFSQVIYIPGNHEYYRHEYHAWNKTMDDRFTAVLTKTQWANDKVGFYIHEGQAFIFATMWTEGGRTLDERAKVGACLNDFRLISMGQRPFTVSQMKLYHQQQKTEIVQLLQDYQATIRPIVITHHMPSYMLCHPRFGTDINGGFAAECDDILHEDYAPPIWIYGHTHDCGDRVLHGTKTRLVANPMGYPSEFSPNSPYNKYKNGPFFVEV